MRMRSKNLSDRTRPGELFSRRATRPGVVFNAQTRPATLVNRRAAQTSAAAQSGETALPPGPARGGHWPAFAGVYLFTLLLYARPNDLFPAIGGFPLVKIVAVGALLIY